jgi:hypothetical protein
VAAFLVTGNPGSGKTALARELARRGLAAIDPDRDPELAFWEDEEGNRGGLADRPAVPTEQWLRAHRWVWDPARLKAVLAKHDGPVFVCGIALNLDALVDLFEDVFLLRIDAAIQEERLGAHDRDWPPGRNEAERQQIRDGRPIFEARMLALGAIALDGSAPTAAVADELLRHIDHQ